MPPFEEIRLARRRFVHKRKIQWGDCDPAAIVYTPRFLDYALEAIDAWMGEILGADWYTMNTKLGIGGPQVQATLDFHSPAHGGEVLDLHVTLEKATRSTLAFLVQGRIAKRHIYTARCITVIIDRKRFKSIPLPPSFRRRVDAILGAKSS